MLQFMEDFIYVSDPGGYKIEKYTSDGTFLKSFDYNFGWFQSTTWRINSGS